MMGIVSRGGRNGADPPVWLAGVVILPPLRGGNQNISAAAVGLRSGRPSCVWRAMGDSVAQEAAEGGIIETISPQQAAEGWGDIQSLYLNVYLFGAVAPGVPAATRTPPVS